MDFISKLGYSRFSPYQNSPFLDIKSPNGLIDMSNTDLPLLGIGMQTGKKKLLRPRSGTYSFPGDTQIREVNLNLPQYSNQENKRFNLNPYTFAFSPERDISIVGVGANPSLNVLNRKNNKLDLTGNISSVSVGYPGGVELFGKPQFSGGLKFTHTFEDGGSVTTTTTLSVVEQYRLDQQKSNEMYRNQGRGDIVNRGVAVPVRQATEYKAETTSKQEQEITKIQKENPGYSRHVATLEYNKRKAPKSTTTISQGKQKTKQEEEDRKRKNYEYALNNGLMYNFNTGDVAEPGKTTVGGGWQKVQAPALVQSFASLTPSGNLGAGRIGAETFTNMNPLFSGPILSTNRLYTGTKSLFDNTTVNPYFGSDKSTFENIIGGISLAGDVANIGIPLKIGKQSISLNSANKYTTPTLTGNRQAKIQIFNNKTNMYETRAVDIPNDIVPGRPYADVAHKMKSLRRDLNIGFVDHYINRLFGRSPISLERDKGLIINPEGRIWDSNTRYWLNRQYGYKPDPLELIEPNVTQYAKSFGTVIGESPVQTMPVGRVIFNNTTGNQSQALQSGIFNTRDLGQMFRNPKQYFTKPGGTQAGEIDFDVISRYNRGEIDPFGETGRFIKWGETPPRVIDWNKVGKTAFELGLGTGTIGSGLLLGNKLKKD